MCCWCCFCPAGRVRQRGSELLIDNVAMSDAGVYSCYGRQERFGFEDQIDIDVEVECERR